MSNILYPAGLYRTKWAEDQHGDHPPFKYLVLSADVEGVKCYDVATMHKTLDDFKGLGVHLPYILYTGVHLPEGNTGSLRIDDIASPYLIKIMKDLRDWPMQAVINLFVDRGISQLVLEDEVLGQADIRSIDFEKVVRHIGFAAAINRKGKGPRIKGDKVSIRSRKSKSMSMPDHRLEPKRLRGRYEPTETREQAERPSALEAPAVDARVWSVAESRYVLANSEEGVRIVSENPIKPPDTVRVRWDHNIHNASVWSGQKLHIEIEEDSEEVEEVEEVAEAKAAEAYTHAKMSPQEWVSAYKAAVVEEERQGLTPKQKHILGMLDSVLNGDEADGFEDDFEVDEVEED